MNLEELKNKTIRERIGITDDFGRIFSFIDFANVNRWFENDRQDYDNKLLAPNDKISVTPESLKGFADIFSARTRIYYGEDPHNQKSLAFTYALRQIFGRRDVVTKNLQRIRHYLNQSESSDDYALTDSEGGRYIQIRKCNFDVELSVDAIKMIRHYDTFCLFSGDADFVYLNMFLKAAGKKIIVIKGGFILATLKDSADLVINAQNIKKLITKINKQRPD
jgi:uncharacterized LabA/DUF88 family protein